MIILELFFSFFKIGCFSIGGGYATIPLLQEQVVTWHGWMSMQEFKDIITISQMTPGPLAINASTFVGLRVGGVLGSLCATIGCILCGACIAIGLYRFFMKHKDSKTIFQILNGLKAASIGFIAASAMTICTMSWAEQSPQDIFLYLLIWFLSFLCIRKWQQHPIMVMMMAGILGYFFF